MNSGEDYEFGVLANVGYEEATKMSDWVRSELNDSAECVAVPSFGIGNSAYSFYLGSEEDAVAFKMKYGEKCI